MKFESVRYASAWHREKPQEAPGVPYCPACRCPMPRDAWGRCVDCAALAGVPQRDRREREAVPVAPPRPPRPRMAIDDIERLYERRYRRVVGSFTRRQRRVFDAFYESDTATMGTAAKALGVSRAAVSQTVATIKAAFNREGLPDPLYPADRPEPAELPSIREAFAALRAAGGDAWDAIADPMSFLSELRGE